MPASSSTLHVQFPMVSRREKEKDRNKGRDDQLRLVGQKE